MGVTVNDLLMTAISMTVKEYFLRKGDEKSSRILMYVPYNLREKPKNPLDFGFINKVAVFPVILDLVNDFKTGVKHISRSLRPLRESFITFAMFFVIQIAQHLPLSFTMSNFLIHANKTSILCTNVHGPSIPYKVAGVKSIKATTFMPNLADIPGGFAMVSHCDIIWISFNSDCHRCDDSKEIIRIFEETLDKILRE